MAEGKMQAMKNMSTRQKVTAGLFVVVLIGLIWMVKGMIFTGSNNAPPSPAMKPPASMAQGPGGMSPVQQPVAPQPVSLQPKPQPISPQDAELQKLQQDTQAKYLAAVSELQMLHLSRDIAETNQAIAAAELSTVTAQKGVIDLLTPKPAPAPVPTTAYVPSLVNPTNVTPTGQTLPPPPSISNGPPSPSIGQAPAQPNYVVLSVSFLMNKWSAVIGEEGKLYNVSIGDILPTDGSRVVSISRSGVILSKMGVIRKISLVSAI